MALAAFSRRFWIEISPDVFLKGTVGEGGFLFDMEQSTIKDVIHSYGRYEVTEALLPF